MQTYYFTEQAYFPAWNQHSGSLRVNLPNRVVDPKVAGDLFHRYYDEADPTIRPAYLPPADTLRGHPRR